jgi:hypothetical protein
MRLSRIVAALAVVAGTASVAVAQIQPPGGQPPGQPPAPPAGGPQAFVGCFAGQADVKAAVGGKVVESKRRLAFLLEPTQNGFKAAWASLEQVAGGGEAVRRLTQVEFTRNPNGIFMGRVQTQQGQENSVYFARFVGNNLVMQTLGIEGDGRFVTSTYIRQVQGATMTARYSLFYDGQAARILQGQLQKIDCAQLRGG